MKKISDKSVDIKNNKEVEKYSAFLKKNRSLRIEIKSLLCEQKESEKKIEEMKKMINVYGLSGRLSLTLENEQIREKHKLGNTRNTTKRELIIFRDYLLEENEKLLFILKRKLI